MHKTTYRRSCRLVGSGQKVYNGKNVGIVLQWTGSFMNQVVDNGQCTVGIDS